MAVRQGLKGGFERRMDRWCVEERDRSCVRKCSHVRMMETYQIGAFCRTRLVESVAFRVEIC